MYRFCLSFILSLCLFSFHFWQEFAHAYSIEQKQESKEIEIEVQINTLLESSLTRTLLQTLLKEELISLMLKEDEFVNFFSLLNFSTEKKKALLSTLVELKYSDAIVSTKSSKKNVYFYTQSAKLINKAELVKQLPEMTKDIYLLLRLEEVENDRIYSIKAVKNLLDDLNTAEKNDFSVFALENEIKTLYALNYLEAYLQELVFEMDFSREKQVELEHLMKYGKHTLSFSNALAEYYLFLDRPQAALDTLKNIKNIQSYFSKYLTILTAMRRGEIGLAELDLKEVLSKIDTKNDIYAYFIVLKGSIAQMKGLNAQMCQAYKLACTHNLCDAYNTMKEDCSWLNN